MPLEDQFKQGVEQFLQLHATKVEGAGGNVLAGNQPNGSQVAQEISRQNIDLAIDKPGGNEKTGVSLSAPLFGAEFSVETQATDVNFLNFSRPIVKIKLRRHGGGNDLPVYLVPYNGGQGQGVKLPRHGADAYPVAYAMTATQNGCTVEVSGNPQQVYASHTNVIDTKGSNASQTWIARQQKVDARLFELQQRFVQEETNAPLGDSNLPGQNRTQFGHYDQDDVHGPDNYINYTSRNSTIANRAQGREGKLSRESTFWGHYRYFCVPTDETILQASDPKNPPNALVVGRRDTNGWVFYYQVYTIYHFRVLRQSKIRGLKLKKSFILNDSGKPKQFSATVVLDYGQLWPNRTEHLCTFGA